MNKKDWMKIKEFEEVISLKDFLSFGNWISIPLIGSLAWWIVWCRFRFGNYEKLMSDHKASKEVIKNRKK